MSSIEDQRAIDVHGLAAGKRVRSTNPQVVQDVGFWWKWQDSTSYTAAKCHCAAKISAVKQVGQETRPEWTPYRIIGSTYRSVIVINQSRVGYHDLSLGMDRKGVEYGRNLLRRPKIILVRKKYNLSICQANCVLKGSQYTHIGSMPFQTNAEVMKALDNITSPIA